MTLTALTSRLNLLQNRHCFQPSTARTGPKNMPSIRFIMYCPQERSGSQPITSHGPHIYPVRDRPDRSGLATCVPLIFVCTKNAEVDSNDIFPMVPLDRGTCYRYTIGAVSHTLIAADKQAAKAPSDRAVPQ